MDHVGKYLDVVAEVKEFTLLSPTLVVLPLWLIGKSFPTADLQAPLPLVPDGTETENREVIKPTTSFFGRPSEVQYFRTSAAHSDEDQCFDIHPNEILLSLGTVVKTSTLSLPLVFNTYLFIISMFVVVFRCLPSQSNEDWSPS
jgi:hypothetical protein